MFLTGIVLSRMNRNQYLPTEFSEVGRIDFGNASEFSATNGADYIRLENAVMTAGKDPTELLGVRLAMRVTSPEHRINPFVELDTFTKNEDGTYTLNFKII